MKILVACEESQAVTIAFRKLGFEACSCDLLPCSGGHPEWHIQGDAVEEAYSGKYDMMIAFPPCTHIAVSGQWAYTKGKKPLHLKQEGIDLFMKFAEAPIEYIVIENPVGIMSTVYRKLDQIVQPWMFGDKASKTTCLWLKNLPLLIPDTKEKPDFEYHTWIDKKSGKTKRMEKWMYDIRTKPHKERGGLASKTFPGIANAIASQWSKIL
jgi:site-specific DNA-cytosine methylase